MDVTDEPTHGASGSIHTAADNTTKDQMCESGSCSSDTGLLGARTIPRTTTTTWTTKIITLPSDKYADTTTRTTVYVGPSSTEHTRTRTKTGWTETLDSSPSHEDPWTTKWITETVAGSAADPSWTTVVTSPGTTTTTTTTLAPVATPTEKIDPLRKLPRTSKPIDFDLLTTVTSDGREWRITRRLRLRARLSHICRPLACLWRCVSLFLAA